MRFAIFYNPKTNPDHEAYGREIAHILEKCQMPFVVNPDGADLVDVDVALSIGGDGTLLYVANLLAPYGTPILGINFGHRGYLCASSRDQAEHNIRSIINGRNRIEEKTRVQAKIERQENTAIDMEALNEISIGGINRTVRIAADIATPDLTISSTITGDGLIVATRTGSTAYNINAGGPMLLTEALSIVANNAFFQSKTLLPITKSLVVPSNTTIRIRNLSHNETNFPCVIADGQDSYELEQDDLVTINVAPHKNRFIRL